MTGWAKMASPAGKGQQIFMIAVAVRKIVRKDTEYFFKGH